MKYWFSKIYNLIAFTLAAILILLWENLTNDLFDAETGIDEFKFHSIVNLVKNKKIISFIAYTSLVIGLLIILIISVSTSINIFILVAACCFLGYLYQGPPFRFGYQGLGEPLCWLAFGPFAYSAVLIALNPSNIFFEDIPPVALSICSKHWRYKGSLLTVAGGMFEFIFTNAQSNKNLKIC